MGEVVVSSRSMEMETGMKDGSSSRVVVRWERFLQRMMLRVLLIEADDSTRQLIVALLRKCGYKVAATPDGVKAWELLSRRPNSIDLILTEVDLPSISGFPLLTLIMGHDICKNIPVIMMSSQDSISTVYKCMMRGAADYLVKPIRRNELKNLWQHVWRRRQFSTAGRNGSQERVAQQKFEVTSENEAASNHSNGCLADVHTHKAYVEKGSDAQSSCTKPEVEAENTRVGKMQEYPQAYVGRSFLGHLNLQRDETNVNLRQKLLMHENETGGSNLRTNGKTNAEIAETTSDEAGSHNIDPDNAGDANTNTNNFTLVSSSRNTTDLIGAFADYPDCNDRNSSSSNGTSNFENASQLDLSLRRCHPNDFGDNLMTERHTLRHSNASAFSRYTNRPIQHLQQKFISVFDEQKANETNPEKRVFGMATGYASHNPDPRLSIQQSDVSSSSAQSNQMKTCPTPIQAKGVRFNDPCSAYGSALSPIFCGQSGLSPYPSPSTAANLASSSLKKSLYNSNLQNNNSEKLSEAIHGNYCNNLANQPREKQGQQFPSSADDGHISLTTGLGVNNSSFCNDAVRHPSGLKCGNTFRSNFNLNQAPLAMSTGECKNKEEDLYLYSTKYVHRSTQREAALSKFRLKRKDRCYEKKVRYESRKKLAEQRPRVKGQFVRRLHIDPPPPA